MISIIFIDFFFQAEDGIRYLVRSRGLGDVYKRQHAGCSEQLENLVYALFFDFVLQDQFGQ